MNDGLYQELLDEGAICKVCSFLGKLLPTEAVEWRAALKRLPRVANTAVVRALAKRGVTLSEASVRRHRARHA
jgi:hypothetical protein